MSCKKKQAITSHEIISTPVSTRVNKSFWLDKNTGFICGGEKGELGYIYKTTDGGSSWVIQYNSNASLYDILFVNDTVGYCCGENITILKTSDAGLHWTPFTKANNFDNFYNGTLYGMNTLNNRVWFFGGKNYNVGLIISTTGNVMKDGFKGFNNEFRCGILSDTNTYLACGYGLCYETSNNAQSFSAVDLGNNYFTSVSQTNQTISFLSDFNGKVYRYDANHKTADQIFKTKHKLKSSIHFNGLCFSSETHGLVVGNDGVVAKTENGTIFEMLNLNTTDNLLSVVSNKNSELIISTNKGKLIKVSN